MPTCEGCGFSSRASTPHVLTEPHDDRQGAFHLLPAPACQVPVLGGQSTSQGWKRGAQQVSKTNWVGRN